MKGTVCFDFDGTIHRYSKGWQGETNIYDPPVDGIREEIARIKKAGYMIIIQSTRCSTTEGWAAVSAWLVENNIEFDNVVVEKPPAVAYIDDRAIQFRGNPAGLLEEIEELKPWWEKKGSNI